jgi:hypothetical protein
MDYPKPQRLSIDLERNEDLARIVADVEPGETLRATLLVVHTSDKTLEVEVQEVDAPEGVEVEDVEEVDDEGEDEVESAGGAYDSPAMKVMRGNKG